MPNWPNIAEPVFPITRKAINPAYATSFEGPYRQIRKKWSGMDIQFRLTWDDKVSLPAADFAILEAFYYTNRAVSFTWSVPGEQNTYNVTFDMDELDSQIIVPGWYATQVILMTEDPYYGT